MKEFEDGGRRGYTMLRVLGRRGGSGGWGEEECFGERFGGFWVFEGDFGGFGVGMVFLFQGFRR